MLEEKRRLLEGAIGAIREAEAALHRGDQPGSSVLTEIMEVMELHDNPDWMLKYFDDEAKPKLQARKQAWTPELQVCAEKDWSDLFNDIRAALDEDPSTPKAQAFVDRWNDLVKGVHRR